ncbi:MAG: hypothetical protein ABI315_16300 [Bacteroidia bacterium]
MKYYTTKPGQYPDENKNNQNEFFGNGWSIKKENDKFILNYISGSLQGDLKTIEISEDDFNAAKKGETNLDNLCIKYNVF